ncbi:MAG: RHS repeat-associated core domain-containing protein [Verrucomicrobiota bacterium]
MNDFVKTSITTISMSAILISQLQAYLPPISFESPQYSSGQPVGNVNGSGWSLLSGNASISPLGSGVGGGQALKIAANAVQEPLLVRDIDWNVAEKVAFIDLQLKPAADPEGSLASFHSNGTQLAFQVPSGGSVGSIWVYNGSSGEANPAQWAKTVGTFALAANGLTAADYSRITLRHDYQRNIWDLFIGGKMAAANLAFEGRGANLENIELYGSKLGDTLIDDLTVNPANTLFPDADKDGLPDAWESANGSNPNLYDRDSIHAATGKSHLDRYMDSLWLGGLNGSSPLPPQGSIPPVTILGTHQPVTSLKGSMSVGGDGSMTYSMPIDIPKGTAGMEPKVSLGYSSGAGNGIAGVGWSLSGFQSITRGAASLQKDGFEGAVRFDGDDRFFFNGEKLICVAGTYGQQNSEYRTEIDSFSRIILKGGNQNSTNSWWQVETKAGLIIQLGNSTGSKIVSPLYSAPISWDVSKVSDTNGNYYLVNWAGQATHLANVVTDRRVTSVDYTGNASGLAPYCSIVFNYEVRPDKSFAYHASGLRYETNQRLKDIAVKTGTYTNHTYFLNYQTSLQTGRSVLASMFRQHAGGYTTSPTVFSWQGTNDTGSKWAKADHIEIPSYDNGTFDSTNRDITSFVETQSDSIRLEGGVGRLVAQTPAVVVTAPSFVEFQFRADNLDRGAYLIVDTNDVWNSNSEFVIRVCPDSSVSGPINGDRTLIYTAAENSQWKTCRVALQGGASGSNLAAGSYPYLAFVNHDNDHTNGVSWSEFKNIRFGTTSQLDNNQVAAATFPDAAEIPLFSSSSNLTRGMRFMDLNNDGLLDLTDYRVTDWKIVNLELTTENDADVVGGVYLNSGGGFHSDETYKPIGRYPLTDSGQDDSWAGRHDLTAVPCDINGDGKMDLFVTENKKAYNSYTSINKFKFLTHNGTGWVELAGYSPTFESRNNNSSKGTGGIRHLISRDLIDVDKDGYLDLYINTSDAGWLANASSALSLPLSAKILPESSRVVFLNRCHLGQGWVRNDSLAPPENLRISDENITFDIGRALADLNGDGFLDYVKSTVNVPNSAFVDTRYTGKLRAPSSSASLPSWLSAIPNQNIPDWKFPAAVYPSTANMNRSNPTSVDGNAPLVQDPDSTTLRKNAGTQMVDVNGDGLVDIVRGFARLFSSNSKIELSHSTWFNRGDTAGGTARWLKDASTYGQGYTLPLSLNSDVAAEQPCVEFSDLNGDGLVDVLYSRDGDDYIGPNGVSTVTSTDPFSGTNNGAFINTGMGWVQDASWGLPDGFRLGTENKSDPTSMMADLNGDGFTDIVAGIRDGARPVVYLNQAKPEIITAITDGFGSELQVQYHRLNDPTPTAGFGTRVYEKFTGTLPAGHASLIDSRLVVSRYSEANGLGGRNWKSQRYGDLRYDKTNEASLGFGWVEALDEINGQLTRTDSHREFPFAGSPVLTQTSVNLTALDIALMPPNHAGCPAFTAGRKNLSIQTATYAEMPSQTGTGGTIRRPIQTTSVNQIFDLDGTLKGETATTQNLTDFDAYGFVESSSVTSLDGSSVVTNNQYNHIVTADKWHLGRLSSASVTKTRSGLLSSQKNSAFTYDTATGLLKSETVEPGHPLSVTKSYTHDAYGNVLSTTVTGSGLTRSSSTSYDSKGRFVISETNQLGYTATHNYDSDKALVLSTTDINGLTTSFAYDPFGTLIKTIHPDSTVTAEVTGYAANFSVPNSVWPHNSTQNIAYFRAKQSSGSPIGKVYLDALGRELVTETTILKNGTAAGSSRYGKVYTVTRYDSQGRKYSVSDSFAAGETPNYTTIEYDLLSRVIRTNRPGNLSDAIVEQGSCMLNGQPTTYSKTINVAGQVLERWEDQHGKLVQSKDPSGQTTLFNHDVEGRLISVSVGGTTLLTNTFDTFGNKLSVTETNSGTSSSVYNAFGEVLSSTNAKGQTSTFTYDLLGRPLTITQPEGTYTTTYSNASGSTRGKVTQITGSGAASGYQESFTYDSLGRPLTTSKTQFGETFTTSTVYDALGRVASSTDAGGLTVMNGYDETYSFPLRQTLAPGTYEGAGTVLWQAGTYDSKGRTLTQQLAQNVNISASYDPAKGDVLALSATRNGNSIQNKTYTWDSLGNLNTRNDLVAKRSETFGYDTLNRLTSSSVVALPGATITSVPPPQTYSYDIKGNLLTKGNSATLTYASPTRIHAVTSATVKGFNRTYSYDAAGYVTSDGKRTYTWTSFGQLKSLQYQGVPSLKDFSGNTVHTNASSVVSLFDFDAAGGRARQTKERISGNDSRKIETTLYLGSYERENHTTKTNGSASPVLVKTVHRHSLGGGMIYTRVLGGIDPGTKLTNVIADHLGSTDALVVGIWNGSSFASQSTEYQSFDAWGERRDANTQISYRASDADPFRTSAKDHDRGYTGHEQLDDSGLIHMNGRIFDPELGRFLSPDPVVQIPEYSQNFNRYSYVLNNPLNATDPSGFSFISKAFSKIGSFIKENWRTIVVIVVVAVAAWAATAYLSSLGGIYTAGGVVGAKLSAAGMAVSGGFAGAIGGGLGPALNGGDIGDVLRGAVVGGIQGAIAGGVLHGMTPQNPGFNMATAEHVAGHGILGGAANAAMGGKFQDGFLSAAAGAAASHMPFADGSVLSRTVKASVVGGTTSVIGGGKFANGAYTAAFQHILNAEAGGFVSNFFGSIGRFFSQIWSGVTSLFRSDPVASSGTINNNSDSLAPWMTVAQGEIGQKEYSPGWNPRIKEYQSTSVLSYFIDDGGPGRRNAWCACFVSWALQKAGVTPLSGYGAMRASEYLTYGDSVNSPIFGAIAIQGKSHVGFVYGVGTGGQVVMLGGNQGDAVSVNFYSAKAAGNLTYRWPTGLPRTSVKQIDITGIRNQGGVE